MAKGKVHQRGLAGCRGLVTGRRRRKEEQLAWEGAKADDATGASCHSIAGTEKRQKREGRYRRDLPLMTVVCLPSRDWAGPAGR